MELGSRTHFKRLGPSLEPESLDLLMESPRSHFRPSHMDRFRPDPGAPTLAVGRSNGPGTLFVLDRANKLLRRIDSGTVTSLSFVVFPGSGTPVTLDFSGPFGGGIAVEPVTARRQLVHRGGQFYVARPLFIECRKTRYRVTTVR